MNKAEAVRYWLQGFGIFLTMCLGDEVTVRFEFWPFLWHLRAYLRRSDDYGANECGIVLGPFEMCVTWQ